MPKHASFESVEHMKHVLGEEARQQIQGVESQLAQIAINVKEFGAVGDGVTDDSLAFQNALSYVAENHLILETDYGKTYIVDDLKLVNRNNFKINSKGVLKRKDNLPATDPATVTMLFENCTDFEIEQINFDGNHYNNHCVVGGIDYNTEYNQEWRHSLSILNCKNVKIGTLNGKNPSGDILNINGNNTFNISINEVNGLSVDENGDHIALGRNTVTISGGKQININEIKGYGVGHNRMPGGLDIEPNNGGIVEDVYVNYVKVFSWSMNPLGITTNSGNGQNIKNITIDHVFIDNHAIDKKRLIVVTGASNVFLGKCHIRGTELSYATHIGMAGTEQPVYNLQIDELEINGCMFGVMAKNLYGGRIKTNIVNCQANFLRLYNISDFHFNVTGSFAEEPTQTSDLFCINHVGSGNRLENVTFSGNLSKKLVGNHSKRALNTSSNVEDVINCELKNLNLDGWWIWTSQSRIITGEGFRSLDKTNCKGLTHIEDFETNTYTLFKTGDIIYNTKPIELGEDGNKYVISNWFILSHDDDTAHGAVKVENRLPTGN